MVGRNSAGMRLLAVLLMGALAGGVVQGYHGGGLPAAAQVTVQSDDGYGDATCVTPTAPATEATVTATAATCAARGANSDRTDGENVYNQQDERQVGSGDNGHSDDGAVHDGQSGQSTVSSDLLAAEEADHVASSRNTFTADVASPDSGAPAADR